MAKALFADFALTDQDWADAGKEKVDPVIALRAKVVAYVDTALAQAKAGEENPPRGAYKTKFDLAQVTIKAGRDIVSIDGRERTVIRKDKLVSFLEAVKDAAETGKLDAALSTDGAATTSKASTGARSAAWTPERRAAHAEKLKASWAARQGTAKKK